MITFITKYNFYQSVTARRSGLVACTLPSRYERKWKIRAVTCMCGYVLVWSCSAWCVFLFFEVY